MKTRFTFLALALVFAGQAMLFPAQAGEFVRDAKSSALVWNNHPRENDIAQWTGNVDDDGFATGFGLLIWYIATDFQVGYFGIMRQGRLHGEVRSFDLEGHYRIGRWKDGKRTKDWKEIKDPNLKKFAASDIENLIELMAKARRPEHTEGSEIAVNEDKEEPAPEPRATPVNDGPQIGNAFLEGVASRIGEKAVDGIVNFFSRP